MTQKVRAFTLTLKPAGDGCNLACTHCYVAGEPKKAHVMNAETLHEVLERASEHAERVKISWHGGEPLLAGVDFWKEALEYQSRLPARFRNIVQSNLTLVDEAWADFLVKNRIPVGTSLDGIRDIHDAYRVHPDGSGSFDEVLRGIDLLREHGYDDVGAIACYTKYMAGRLMEVYDAFRKLGISWKISPLIKSGRGDEADGDVGADIMDFAAEFNAMVDRYLFDAHSPRIGTVDNFIADLAAGAKSERSGVGAKRSCQNSNVAIDPNGDAYPCGRFTQTPEARLGNVHDMTFEEIFSASFKRDLAGRNYDTVEGCSGCDYRKACMAGCAHSAWLDNNGDLSGRDGICEANKEIYGHILHVVGSLRKGGVANGSGS